MNSEIIALLSAVTVAVVSLGGNIIINRLNRKDVKEDKSTDKLDLILKRIDDLEAKTDHLEKRVDENSVVECRVRIRQFADEIRRGVNHSKDSYDQVIDDIDRYDAFCSAHTSFPNGITRTSEKLIMDNYESRMELNDFL